MLHIVFTLVCIFVCVYISSVNSLGQWCVLQNIISTVNPVQSSSRAPAVIHFLVLLWRPPPQDRLHSVQLVHSLHVLGGGEVGFSSSSGLVSLESNSSRVSGPSVNVALFRNSVDGIISIWTIWKLCKFFNSPHPLQQSPGSQYGALPSGHTSLLLHVSTSTRISPVTCEAAKFKSIKLHTSLQVSFGWTYITHICSAGIIFEWRNSLSNTKHSVNAAHSELTVHFARGVLLLFRAEK